MKIKDCAVINIELLKHEVAVLRKNCEIFREFNDHQAVSSRMRVINTIESVIENSKPLTPIIQDALDEVRLKSSDTAAPEHYINTKGSLYAFAEHHKLNSWEFDAIKRIVRCRKKGSWRQDLEKTKVVIDLYLKEYNDDPR